MDGISTDHELARGHRYRATLIHSTMSRGTFQLRKPLSDTEEALEVNDAASSDQIDDGRCCQVHARVLQVDTETPF